MEEQFNTKLTEKLIEFERSSKKWEWSDLIKWLSGLKQLIDKYSQPAGNDNIHSLSRRLGQCLSPTLPHGLHSKTLEIYSSLLSISSIFHISIISTGLFPSFQHCAPQIKAEFLIIINENFIKRFDEVRFLLRGLISCLLTGAHDTPDTISRIIEVLDQCEAKDKAMTYKTLWWFVLKTEKHRAPGLMYMQKKNDGFTEKWVIANSLLESLNDNSVIIRRSSLDFIRLNFPLTPDINENLITLMQGTLKLFRGKDHTLFRRIWEWIFPNEYDDKQVQIVIKTIKPAILRIFNQNSQDIQNNKNPDDAKIMTIKIIESLCDNEIIGKIILQEIAVDLVKHTVNDELCIVKNQKDNRIKQIFSDENSRIFWRAFEKKMLKMLNKNEGLALKILEYAYENFDFVVDSFFRIFPELFQELPRLKDVMKALKLLNKMIKHLQVVEIDVDRALAFYISLLEEENMQVLFEYVALLGRIKELGMETPEILSSMLEYMRKDFIMGIRMMVKYRSGLTVGLLSELWGRLEYLYEEVCELLNSTYEVAREEWNAAIVSLLLHNNTDIQEKSMRWLIKYWQYTIQNNKNLLDRISRYTKIVFIMIDHLASNNPITRHIAKEWLCIAQSSMHNLMDPILKVMLHKSTVRDLNSDGFYKYCKNFDCKRVEESIRKTLLIVENGGKDIIYDMEKSELSKYCDEKLKKHNISESNYLGLLLHLMLLFIQTPLYYENIQGTSADLLCILSSNTSIIRKNTLKPFEDLASRVLSSVSEILYKILHQNPKLEMYILKVLDGLISNNSISLQIDSKFTDCLLLGLMSEKPKFRNAWMKLINLTLPSIFNSITGSPLTKYINQLFTSYYKAIIDSGDFSLLEGLSMLINTSLNINSHYQFLVQNTELKDMLKNEIEAILEICFKCYKSQNDLTDILNCVTPICNIFRGKFVKALFDQWKKFTLNNLSKEELKIIVKMTTDFNLSVEAIIDILLEYLDKPPKNPISQVLAGSFIVSLFEVLENFKIPISLSSLWGKTINLCKFLSICEMKESIVLQINLIYTLSTKIRMDKPITKELQDLLKGICLKSSEFLRYNFFALPICYSSVEVVKETVTNKIFNTLHEKGNFLFDIVWALSPKPEKTKCVVLLLSNVLPAIKANIEGCECIGKVVYAFIRNNNEVVAGDVMAGLMDIFKNHLLILLQQHPTSYKAWKRVLNHISNNFYTDKTALLVELMHYFEPYFWTSASTILKLLYNSAALMSFLIFSSHAGTYTKALQGISEKVKKILNSDIISSKLTKVLLVLLKVLFLRLPKTEFTSLWQEIWPSLHLLFCQSIESKNTFCIFEVLQFLDFVLATGFDINYFIGLYLFDVPEFYLDHEENATFQPILGQSFISGFKAHPSRKMSGGIYNSPINKRKLLLAGKTLEEPDELDGCAKTLLQYCSYYASEPVETDWPSVETEIEKEICRLGFLGDNYI